MGQSPTNFPIKKTTFYLVFSMHLKNIKTFLRTIRYKVIHKVVKSGRMWDILNIFAYNTCHI